MWKWFEIQLNKTKEPTFFTLIKLSNISTLGYQGHNSVSEQHAWHEMRRDLKYLMKKFTTWEQNTTTESFSIKQLLMSNSVKILPNCVYWDYIKCKLWNLLYQDKEKVFLFQEMLWWCKIYSPQFRLGAGGLVELIEHHLIANKWNKLVWKVCFKGISKPPQAQKCPWLKKHL